MRLLSACLGLRVVALDSREELGTVTHLVTDPLRGRVRALVLPGAHWYSERRAVLFSDVVLLGPSLVVVSSAGAVRQLSEMPEIHPFLSGDGKARVYLALSATGEELGAITEWAFEEETAEVVQHRLVPQGAGPALLVPRCAIVARGESIVVIDEGVLALRGIREPAEVETAEREEQAPPESPPTPGPRESAVPFARPTAAPRPRRETLGAEAPEAAPTLPEAPSEAAPVRQPPGTPPEEAAALPSAPPTEVAELLSTPPAEEAAALPAAPPEEGAAAGPRTPEPQAPDERGLLRPSLMLPEPEAEEAAPPEEENPNEHLLAMVLGLRADRDVTDDAGEVIVSRGEEITEQVVNAARRAWKLYDLLTAAE